MGPKANPKGPTIRAQLNTLKRTVAVALEIAEDIKLRAESPDDSPCKTCGHNVLELDDSADMIAEVAYAAEDVVTSAARIEDNINFLEDTFSCLTETQQKAF